MIDQFRFCLTYSGFISSNATPLHGNSVKAYATSSREKPQIMYSRCTRMCKDLHILHIQRKLNCAKRITGLDS